MNQLGIDLGRTPEEILDRLERGAFSDTEVHRDRGRASDSGYESRVRDIRSASPARYNADPERLHGASGCAGKLCVFAVRLDSFPEDVGVKIYYIGTNDPAALIKLRRRMLAECSELPVSGEYLHREIFDVARVYGKNTLLLIHWLGTQYLPLVFALKGRIEAQLRRFSFLPGNLQADCFPRPCPSASWPSAIATNIISS